MKSSYYPLSLKITGKSCVVVGGGVVAWRKASSLLEYGASITVISPDICDELKQLAENQKIKAITRKFEPEDIRDAYLVIAATDSRDVNEQVSREARKYKVPVNVVDDADQSDFIVPASFRRGDLIIAVSTSGRSPALSRKLKEHLEQYLGPEYAGITDLVAEIRSDLKSRGIKVQDEAWQKALNLDLLSHLLRNGEKNKARSIIISQLIEVMNI